MIGPNEHRKIKHKGATFAAAALHQLDHEGTDADLVGSFADGMIDGTVGYLLASLGAGATKEALRAALERARDTLTGGHEVQP